MVGKLAKYGQKFENFIFCFDGTSKCKYKCPVCSNDEYVKAGICSGIFNSNPDFILRGGLSCRCKSRYNWSEEQYLYKAKKILQDEDNYDIVSVKKEPYKGVFVTYDCKYHGHQVCTFKNLSKGKRCFKCANKNHEFCYILEVTDSKNTFLKFGVAKNVERRVIEHKSNNQGYKFKILDKFRYKDPNTCLLVEKMVKSKVVRFLDASSNFKGYTETCDLSFYNEITEIMKNHLQP